MEYFLVVLQAMAKTMEPQDLVSTEAYLLGLQPGPDQILI